MYAVPSDPRIITGVRVPNEGTQSWAVEFGLGAYAHVRVRQYRIHACGARRVERGGYTRRQRVGLLERVHNVKVDQVERAVVRLRAQVRLDSVDPAQERGGVGGRRQCRGLVGVAEGAVVVGRARVCIGSFHLVAVPREEACDRVAHERDAQHVRPRQRVGRLVDGERVRPHGFDRARPRLGHGAHHHEPVVRHRPRRHVVPRRPVGPASRVVCGGGERRAQLRGRVRRWVWSKHAGWH